MQCHSPALAVFVHTKSNLFFQLKVINPIMHLPRMRTLCLHFIHIFCDPTKLTAVVLEIVVD